MNLNNLAAGIHAANVAAGWFGHDIEGAMREKLAFNKQRIDHTREHRAADGGKKF